MARSVSPPAKVTAQQRRASVSTCSLSLSTAACACTAAGPSRPPQLAASTSSAARLCGSRDCERPRSSHSDARGLSEPARKVLPSTWAWTSSQENVRQACRSSLAGSAEREASTSFRTKGARKRKPKRAKSMARHRPSSRPASRKLWSQTRLCIVRISAASTTCRWEASSAAWSARSTTSNCTKPMARTCACRLRLACISAMGVLLKSLVGSAR
mmetsp:Transcript_40006/g.115283  ORF Transcript_40006/g.115283 Transcript_40006/m.115283 type:complete len:214 (-) Transcript_40006:587-1228(-)